MEPSYPTEDRSNTGIYLHHVNVKRAGRSVLQDITLHINTGEHVAIIGPNGSRILIGRALVHTPKMLILDEPSTALDIHAHRDLLITLNNIACSGIGVIMITHDFNDIIPEITRVLFLRDGRIIADGTRDSLLTNVNLSMLFDTDVRMCNCSGSQS